jgi:hypothetical protein
MRYIAALAIAVLVVLSAPTINFSQGGQGDASRTIAGGGIHVPGWEGKIDKKEAEAGMTISSAKFVKDGEAIHVTTGPAVTYWNPEHKATGDYTVTATFKEPKYMNLNAHPHPYGLMIAGSDLGTDEQSYLYCATYGNGRFIVRGFGPAPFQLNGRGAEDPVVNKAAGPGEPVMQEIAMSVKGDKVECAVNGKVVASYDKASVVGSGKLKSTDGIYGLRFGHNIEVIVSGAKHTKH